MNLWLGNVGQRSKFKRKIELLVKYRKSKVSSNVEIEIRSKIEILVSNHNLVKNIIVGLNQNFGKTNQNFGQK